MATVAFAGTGETGLGLANPDNSDDVFNALGPTVFGDSGIGKALEILLILSVLSSASASTQTTILPTARTTLAMGAYKAVPSMFARIHPKYLTPTVATIWMGAVSIIFYVGLTLVSENVLGDSIAAVGLMIAFYYGLTGFAAVWFYRTTLFSSLNNFVMKGLFPFLGGIMLLGAFVIASYQYAQPDYGSTTLGGIGGVFIIGIGTLLLGVVLMVIWYAVAPGVLPGRDPVAADPLGADPARARRSRRRPCACPTPACPTSSSPRTCRTCPRAWSALDLETGEEIENTGQLRALRAEQAQEDDEDGQREGVGRRSPLGARSPSRGSGRRSSRPDPPTARDRPRCRPPRPARGDVAAARAAGTVDDQHLLVGLPGQGLQPDGSTSVQPVRHGLSEQGRVDADRERVPGVRRRQVLRPPGIHLGRCPRRATGSGRRRRRS